MLHKFKKSFFIQIGTPQVRHVGIGFQWVVFKSKQGNKSQLLSKIDKKMTILELTEKCQFLELTKNVNFWN